MTQRTAGMKAGGSRFSSFKRGAISMETPHQKQTIVIIAVIAVVVIAGLFFIGSRVVGKAIDLPAGVFGVGTGGFEAPIALPKSAGDIVSLQVGARLPGDKSSVAYSFTIEYPDDALEFVDIDSKLVTDTDADKAWGSDFIRTSPLTDSGTNLKQVTFEHATLNFRGAITGGQRLAEVNLKAKKNLTAADVAKVKITKLDVLSLSDDTDLVNVPPESEVIRTNEICVAWLNGLTVDQLLEKITLSQKNDLKTRLCVGSITGGYNPDINADGNIDGQDAFIILIIAEAKVSDCGNNAPGNNAPCNFVGTYVCDNGDFRVEGYKGYTHTSEDTCSDFANTADYLAR